MTCTVLDGEARYEDGALEGDDLEEGPAEDGPCLQACIRSRNTGNEEDLEKQGAN